MAVCIFQTSSGTIEIRVALDDVAQLLNTLIAKTHWTLVAVHVAQAEDE